MKLFVSIGMIFLCAAAPVTTLHYAPNGNFSGSTFLPGTDGFNLADVSNVDQVNVLPAGAKGLVWIGMTNGNSPSFQAAIKPFLGGNPKLYGFYLADEPTPSAALAANLKAESDYIHANVPGAMTFIALENEGSPQNPNPTSYLVPGKSGIDLFGVDPYPCRPVFKGCNYSVITAGVNAAVAAGYPLSSIVPVYQAFGATSGDYSSWSVPTAAQENQILSTWGAVVPHPAFDYAYSWGVQDGDTALSNDIELQQVFAAHDKPSSASSCPQ